MCLLCFIHFIHRSPWECCTELLEDWVTTDNGVKPKTLNNLINILSEIEVLQPVIEDIKQSLKSEGVTLFGMYDSVCIVCTYIHMYVHMYVYMNVLKYVHTYIHIYVRMYCVYGYIQECNVVVNH